MKQVEEKYSIIWGNSTSLLSEKINKELKAGWELVGGVASGKTVILGVERNILYQAVKKQL